MKGILFLRLFVFWIIIFYSKEYEFNEELSQIIFNESTKNMSIFNGKYFYYLNLQDNDILKINFKDKTFTINCSEFNETFNNNSFINLNLIKNDSLNFIFGNKSCNSSISSNYTIYSFQLLLTHYCFFYGNFLIISGIIVALYGNKFKLIVKIIFFIYLLYSFSEFIIEVHLIKFNPFKFSEMGVFYTSVGSIILGTFFGIILNERENISYYIIFGLTFYNTLYYLVLDKIINNLMIYEIFLLIFIFFGVICQIFNSNEILFIIGTSISGSYFIISGLNCFLGGFYYYYFKISGYYKKDDYWNSCIIYYILHIIQIVLSILFQKTIKNIEKEGVDQAETTKKYINKNLSGSTYILNPNQTNDYNLSLTANYNKRDGAVFSDNNLSEIKENESNSTENAEIKEESNVSG